MIKLVAALIPYAAVGAGMYCFHNAWLAIALYHLGIIGCLACRKPVGLGRKIAAGIRSPLLIPGLVVCALAAPVVYFMWPWFAASDGILPEWMARFGLSGRAWLLLIPWFSIIHPVLEELHWRGIAPQPFVWICREDLLFAGYHVLVLFQLIKAPWLVLVFAVLVGSSIFWRWSAERFGGYGLSIATHAMADAGVLAAVCFLLRA